MGRLLPYCLYGVFKSIDAPFQFSFTDLGGEVHKKQAYAIMMHDFLVNLRSGGVLVRLSELDIKKIANALHNLPLYLAYDFEGCTPYDDTGFNELNFWKTAYDAHSSLVGDFVMAIGAERMRGKMIARREAK